MKHCLQATVLVLFAALACSSLWGKPMHVLGDREVFGSTAMFSPRSSIYEAAAQTATDNDIPAAERDAADLSSRPQASLPSPVASDVIEPNPVVAFRPVSADTGGLMIFATRYAAICRNGDCFRMRSGWTERIGDSDHHPGISPEPAPLTLLSVGGLALLAVKRLRRART